MISRSTDGKQRVLSLSYGKDSLACLGAIEQLGLSLDRIVHAEVWATDTIPADLPPMVEFKKKADEIIKSRWGIYVEHFRADFSYEDVFYRERKSARGNNKLQAIYGFPYQKGPWCNDRLKLAALKKARPENKDTVSYVGIAVDEPNRFNTLSENRKSPLVEIGWDEAKCREWCEQNDLISPIYTTATRGGCWFCHNQGIDQLRLLRKNYPEYWQLLLRLDKDSPVPFHASGHTVNDFDHRFRLEDEGLIDPKATFRWSMLDDDLQYTIFKD